MGSSHRPRQSRDGEGPDGRWRWPPVSHGASAELMAQLEAAFGPEDARAFVESLAVEPAQEILDAIAAAADQGAPDVDELLRSRAQARKLLGLEPSGGSRDNGGGSGAG